MEKKLSLINLPLYLRECLDKRARGESKTFDTMLINLYLSSLGFVGIWFGAAKDQIEQPKKYMKWVIENSYLKFLIASDGLLKESVVFKNGGELKLKNLTEMNARSSRADFITYDEEAQAEQDAYNAAVNILAGSDLGLVFHISTPTKGSPFEQNHDRLKIREITTGEQFIFSHGWEDASWLYAKKDWYAEQKKILPDWYFRQEHMAEFTHALGAVFKNVIYEPYSEELLEEIRSQPLLSGADWNPVGGHWLSGGKWFPNLKGFVILHSLPIAVGYTHQLSEESYLAIKEYCTYGKKLCAEAGGINEEYHDWLRLMLSKDRNKRGVNIMWEEWDSQGVNKTNTVLHLLDKTIYIDRIQFPTLAKQIEDCRWKADSNKIEIEKDKVDSPHAFDAFLHAATKKMIKKLVYRRFDWHE